MAELTEICCFNDPRDQCKGGSCPCGCHDWQERRATMGCRFLGEYDQYRVLRCIRCGMLPMQHYPTEHHLRAASQGGASESGEGS